MQPEAVEHTRIHETRRTNKPPNLRLVRSVFVRAIPVGGYVALWAVYVGNRSPGTLLVHLPQSK